MFLLHVTLRPNAMENPVFIPGNIFPTDLPFSTYLHSNFNRGELKISRCLVLRNRQVSEISSRSFQHTCPIAIVLGVQELVFRAAKDSPNFSKLPIFVKYSPKIPKK